MIKRELYLERIRDFYNATSLVKIVYGVRRSGKSILLSQIIDELKKQGIDEDHIININFESLEFSDIKTNKDLDKYIKSQVKDNKIYYVFIDEIQMIDDFEKAVNSLRITNKFSLFIAGSNSKMTFSELSTDLSGRYVSFRINPLCFREAVKLTNTKKENYEKLLMDIFEWGTLPQRFAFNNESAKITYISDVYDSIILKDIVEKVGIKDVGSFNKIVQYILETESREFSATNVIEFLKKENITISTQTLYSYLDALCSAFIINKVNRFDIKGKEILKTLSKFYVTDLGIKKIKSNSSEINYSVSLENIVYNELLVKGYRIYTGKTKKGEIDFIATKGNITKYIQVSYKLGNNQNTIEREFDAFNEINDNYPRYVISMDDENYSRNGIKHLNAIKFLTSKDF